MITGFNPAVSNNRNQRQNFCAVSQKHFEKAQNFVRNKSDCWIPLRDVGESYVAKDLSETDTRDTLEAIRGILPDKFKSWVDEIKEDINLK